MCGKNRMLTFFTGQTVSPVRPSSVCRTAETVFPVKNVSIRINNNSPVACCATNLLIFYVGFIWISHLQSCDGNKGSCSLAVTQYMLLQPRERRQHGKPGKSMTWQQRSSWLCQRLQTKFQRKSFPFPLWNASQFFSMVVPVAKST